MAIEEVRIRALNSESPRLSADYVIYWLRMNQRATQNHALAHAAEIANSASLPLLVFQSLACDGKSANDRFHTFILQAVPGTAAELRRIGAGYFFCLRAPNEIFHRLAARAHSVVTDDYPRFTLAPGIGVPYIAVDSSCIVPMNVHEKRHYAAYTIRPKINRALPEYLKSIAMPRLKHRWRDALLPAGIAELRTNVAASQIPALVAACEIDHSIRPSVEYKGGAGEAQKRLEVFLEDRLRRYARESGQPSKRATSNLSPYLHFGQISALEIALAARVYAEEHKLMADDFLEQLIVRRELASNFAKFAGKEIESLGVLPGWCRRTLEKHAADPRPCLYTPDQFENAATHDDLWNAAQRELLLRGTIHGYYRMYWGKKIIEWSPTYESALRTMLHLHDVYALDGRDPNTYTNILWCFGLHDRPWAERPIFGQLRYVSLDGMKRKTDVPAYIRGVSALRAP